MELLDPRLGLLAAGAAVISSQRTRKTVGKGIGYAVAGTVAVGRPVARPLVTAGRDLIEEARAVAGGNTPARSGSSQSRTKSAR